MTALVIIGLVVLFIAWKVAKALAIVFLVSLALFAWLAMRMGLAVFGAILAMGSMARPTRRV